jgi:hypothetical protein
MLYDSYDPFSFMVILLFIYFFLILFIVMIVYNLIQRRKTEQQIALNNPTIPQTTCADCIPKPTPLPGSKQFY